MIDAALRDLEQAVIGAVINQPANLALLPSLSSTDFAFPWAHAAWDAIRNCEASSQPIDVMTLADEMTRARMRNANVAGDETPGDRDRGEVAVLAFLGQCALRVPTVDNAVEYARRVRDHALRRRLLATFAELVDDARSGEYTGDELLSRAHGGISALSADQPEKALAIGDVVRERLAQLDEIRKERERGLRSITGFPTGVDRLTERLGGWQPGIVSIVAARPGMGKSSLGLSTADTCSAAGVGCHVFSLEDTSSAYSDRVLSRVSKISAEAIRGCTLSREQVDAITPVIHDVVRRKHWLFDDRSGISATEIVRSVRRHKKANATRVAIVDYIQLVAKSSPRMTAHEALSETITTFADAAKQDQIAYVVMSQLNREIEKRTDKRPQLSDLRESGSLEERAKCVVGIYRGALYKEKPKKGVDYPTTHLSEPTAAEFERMAQLLVLKNSNGQTGVVRATWHGETMRLE